MNIGSYTFEDFQEMAKKFHGYPAPGLMVGGYMVETVKSKILTGTLFEAVVETRKCLPDAVQLLTP
ncbi:MAG TPA: formylmethanofuran dehydrogenase subunit E family protein, partial [Desulfohalobiaceae bacterium]|nr:formylmethanofuran dehydrogenase subunit E family protein [Desulfohalobiaceae bacterium]